MNKRSLVEHYKQYPELIKKAETEYLESIQKIQQIKFELIELESELLMGEKAIKNERSEKLREAALFPLTKHLHLKIMEKEKIRDQKKIEYHKVKKECEHLEYIFRILD